MDRSKFMNLYKVVFPNGESSNFCQHVFRTFDQDKNGYIDFKEFIYAIDISTKGSVEDQLRLGFTMFDVDNDGVIDIEELTEIIGALYQMIGKTEANEKAKQIFDFMDIDSDRKITQEEFVTDCIQDEQIIQILNPQVNIHQESINKEKEGKGHADISKETDIL